MTKYSQFIAGCMSWGAWGKNLNKQEMIALLHHYIKKGVTTFDHADIYGDYTTETAFGNAFTESGIARESIQLISKCGIQYIGKTRQNRVKHYDYSKNYIIWSVEESLKKLQTEYLDVLLLHRPSPLMHAYEIAEAIAQLKEQGKIRDFGVSNFTPLQTDLIASKTQVSINQIECSLTQFSALLNGSLDHMQIKGIQPMAWSPLGNYFKEDNQQNISIKKVVNELIKKYNATESQLLLAWLLQHPTAIKPVLGTTNTQRISESVKAKNIQLSTQDWFALLVASQGHKVP